MKKVLLLIFACCLTHFLFADNLSDTDTILGDRNVYIAGANEFTSGNGFNVEIALTNTSEDEFNALIDVIAEKDAYILVDSRFEGDRGSLLFHLQDLSRLQDLNRDIRELKVLYEGESENRQGFQLRRYLYQFDFSKGAAAQARTRYQIQAGFDPETDVNLGGYETRSDADGNAVFYGVGLRLDRAEEGIVFLVDEMGRKAQADREDDGKWYIRAEGIASGEKVSKSILIEVIQ